MLDETQFPFLAEKGHIVSLVGGGGKTTLLHAMAAHGARKGLAGAGFHYHSHPTPERTTFGQNECGACSSLDEWQLCGGRSPAPDNKLTQPPQLERWMVQADAVFLEADGAKHLPCKARRLMNRCCCLKVILCWQWQGSPQWESRCRKSASGWKRPAHCWAFRRRRS